MKKLSVILLILTLIFASLPIVSAPVSVEAESYTIDSEGYEVYELQYILKSFGYFEADCTGYFGNATAQAIKTFQQDLGFEATGIADEDTVAAIRSASCRTATINIKSRLNVREANDSSSEVIDSLMRDSVVYIYSEKDDWYHVETESGTIGFILKKYLSVGNLLGLAGKITGVTDPVNMRQSANLDSAVLCKIENASAVTVIGGSKDWFKIAYQDKVGYIFKKYVSIGNENGSSTSVNEIFDSWTGHVTASSLKLRSGPSTGYDTIKTMAKGTIITVTGQSGDWYYVTLSNGTKGFASKSYVSKGTGATTCTSKASGTLNVRKGPGKSYDVVTTIKSGEVVTLLDDSSSWYKIKTSSGKEGYVDSQYVKLGGSLSSGSSSSVPSGTYKLGSEGSTVVQIQNKLKELGYFSGSATGYYGSKTVAAVKAYQKANGISQTGTCASQTLGKLFGGSSSSNQSSVPDANASLGQQIAAYAKQFIGVPYYLGGNGPKTFDCSGYTRYVFNHFGIKLPRTAYEQGYKGPGTKITSISALQTGDLVFFNTMGDSDLCDHAGIYIGNGQVIHASSGSKRQVTISSMSSNYYKTHFSWGRRVI